MSENTNRATIVHKMWEDGQAHMKKLGLTSQIPLNRNFYENKQWGIVKKGTEKLPRPQFAQIEQYVNTKVANIVSSPVKAQFFSKDNDEAGDTLTNFDEFISKEIKESTLREDVVFSGAIDGSGFLHYFFNQDKRDQRGQYAGGLDCEELDILDIIVSNPRERDIQKQDWIIVSERITVQEARNECDDETRAKLIHSDEFEPKSEDDIEKDDSNLVDVYVRYFRIDNEVYFEKCTKDVVIQEATPLNPDINYNEALKSKNLKTDDNTQESVEDVSNSSTPDSVDKNKKAIRRAFSLYPIAKFDYKKRKKCFYGRSEVEDKISNSVAVNYNTAMMCLSVENQGWGTTVAKEGALGVNVKLTNDPSKILIDKYKGQGQGFYALNKQPFSVQSIQLNNDIIEKTKTFAGVTDVITGQPDYKNQSGYAIAYLQQQALKPIDLMVKNYHAFIEDCEKIKLQFYLLFYDNKTFTVNKEDEATKKEDEKSTNQVIFKREEFIDMDFNITVEVGAGTQFSELGGINMLDNLYASGQITPRQYIKMYPQNILPNKNKLLKIFEENENNELLLTKEKLKETSQYLAQAISLLKEQNTKVYQAQKTLQENERLRGQISDVGGAYTETRNDAEQLARIVKQREIPNGN